MAVLQYFLISVTWLGFVLGGGAERFDCYVCSYTLSSDPSITYECVNATIPTPAKVSCTAPYMCITKAVFNSDRTQVRSVDRNCLPPADFCSGETCCDTNGVYPSCRHICRADMCNNRTAETWLRPKPGPFDGGKGSATSQFTKLHIVFIHLSVFVVALLLL